MTCSPYRIALIIARFAIECDGKAYHSSPKQKAYDRRKDAYLREQGYKVMRIKQLRSKLYISGFTKVEYVNELKKKSFFSNFFFSLFNTVVNLGR
ncbi:endonuclease domain-containing protein [Priestia megaterium]|uniref:endonuclease domain-containing protein n=1 Tax=Priestia megaterium TaxID=1404 RepID=UPI0027E323E4|nr:DUF559 domain-containing protein [Priestia megaterium]